jgi:hypothetical protein
MKHTKKQKAQNDRHFDTRVVGGGAERSLVQLRLLSRLARDKNPGISTVR